MHHNARVLCLDSDTDIAKEMKQVNAEEAGIRHMLSKAKHYLVKLENVRRPIAHILKETFLSNGGDAVVSRDLIATNVSHTDVILCGTRKQFQRACASLFGQKFGCDEIASEIESAIRNFDSPAKVPEPEHFSDSRLARVFREIGRRTIIMGILNVTPDSFSDGGRFVKTSAAIEHARMMVEQGADIIDVGGESTRPGAEPVDSAVEIDRVVPVICELAQSVDAAISVDTYKSDVACAALDNGAHIVNDISSASFDPRMIALLVERRCPAIFMHIQGTPKNMQIAPSYTDLMSEICAYLRQRIRVAVDAGMDERMLIIDPGFGFGKTIEHNLEILRRLREFRSIGRPLLIGTSRKSTIGKVLGDLPVEERLEGTAATVALSIAGGADIIRVHDVKEMARIARMTDAIVRRH